MVSNHETTTETITHRYTASGVTYQVLDLIMGIITGFLFLRFILLLSGANPSAGFVTFVYDVSDIFMAPFQFIFPTTRSGEVVIDWSILIAIIVYSLGFTLIKQIFSVIATAQK